METNHNKQPYYNCPCVICGTPTDGRRLIGTDAYCQSDYDKYSAKEKAANKLLNEKEKIFKQLFDTSR